MDSNDCIFFAVVCCFLAVVRQRMAFLFCSADPGSKSMLVSFVPLRNFFVDSWLVVFLAFLHLNDC